MKTNQIIAVSFGIGVIALLGLFVYQYVQKSSGESQAYILERDRECKTRAAQSAPDEESEAFVRVDDMFYSPSLNACIWAVANSSLRANPADGSNVGYTWVNVQNRDLNNDLVTLETADFYKTKEDLRAFLETKTAEYR